MEEASTTVSKTTTNWRQVRRASPAGEARTAAIRQAIEDALVLGELRRLRGLSQADLAELLDMSQSRISRIEREQGPVPVDLAPLCRGPGRNAGDRGGLRR